MKNWILYSLISMFFAGVTSVIAKIGLKNVSSDTGVAVRTIFVFLIVWLNVFVFQSVKDFKNLTKMDIIYLGISGVTTSLSWIFYYKAIKIGNVSQVNLIDKASILITIVLSFVILNEQITWKTAVGGSLMLAGLLILTLK
ncbi:EamA family transporter [Flavobacterium wongokense]|uniref:EamA family transporter n=1 Tax=Flavobacterium wongokense TaxID=2910674 RepID=UPI001F243DC1|nr:EamA family transporter [Flavobacterium sp. WG47]MCF6133497.1 EamA family transporter [Flavobacterium sp. WG47]